MSEPTEKWEKIHESYTQVAMYCGAACVAITWITVTHFGNVTDAGMFAIAAMVFAPAVLGLGIAYFVHRTSLAETPSRSMPATDAHFFSREGRPGG